MAVEPSEDNGNVSIETEPEVIETSTPVEEKPAEVVVPEVELFDLPDGRKVDAQTLSKEWKENFYPDYTRKSQALAEKAPEITKPTNPLDDPEYVPQTYAELASKIKEDTLREIEERQRAIVERQSAIETEIDTQIKELKTVDPSLNENALFQHANKYGFRDLKTAHQNMKDMSDLAKKVQAKTVSDVAKRTDPVNVTPGATGARPEPTQFATAREYLEAIKASQK